MNTIIIQFVGLLLFTGQWVRYVENARMTPASSEYYLVGNRTLVGPAVSIADQRYVISVIAPSVPGPTPVEHHDTMILFTAGTVTGQWQKVTLSSGWSYVKLSGAAAVDFVADAPNPAVAQLNSVPQPKIGGGNHGTLQAAYARPPFTGAAAVFTITSGVLSACTSGVAGRVDSTLKLNVHHNLIIRSGNNSIVIPPNASVAIVNLPPGMVTNPNAYTPQTSTSHTVVYCAMTGQASNCTLSHPLGLNGCPNGLFAARMMSMPMAHRPGPPPSAQSSMGTDFACSNSQWP